MYEKIRSSAGIFSAWRPHGLALAGAATLLLFVAGGCQSLPPVSEPPPSNVRTIKAGTDLDWTSKSRSCQEARSEVKKAAKRECELASYSIVPDKCACEHDEHNARIWHCSSEAVYTCSDSDSLGLAATE
jgi:hypothetical protein